MGIHLLIDRVGNQVLMVHDYVNPAGWSKQNTILDTGVRPLCRSKRRSCGLFPEASPPQPTDPNIKMTQNNNWLEENEGWPLDCNGL